MDTTYAQDTAQQATNAIRITQQDFTRQPRLPWDSVHEIVGHILPSQWWVVAAHTGNGKTTLLMNLIDDFVAQGKRVYVLPLEQRPEDMMTIQAALECGFKVSDVLAHRWSKLPSDARQRIGDAIQTRADCGSVYYDGLPTLSADGLLEVWMAAINWGADVVVIDHIHHLAKADHKELALVAKRLTEHTKSSGIPAVVAAQLNRGEQYNPLRPFIPPITMDIQGSAHIEQNAHVILGAYRPLGPCTKDELMSAKAGMLEPYKLAKPNAVGLKVLKHRVDGEYTGRTFELEYRHGRITDSQTEDRRLYERRNDL